MAKKEPNGRTLKLEGIFKEATTIFHESRGGKTIEARVHADGTIVYKDKDYTSPSSAANAATGQACNGYVWWKVKDGDKVVTLGEYAGHKPTQGAEAKPKKEAKPKAEKKPKAPRKPRAKKAKPQASEAASEETAAA